MLQSQFTSVLKAATREELRAEMIAFANLIGFQTVSATMVVDRPLAEPEFITIDNTPEGYRQVFEDRESCRMDPVMQYCKLHGIPIIWSQQTYISSGRVDKWETQAAFGYHCGIAFALHMPGGLHFFIGVDRDQALPVDRAEVSRMTADLQLFAVHAQDSAHRMLALGQSPQEALPSLAPRELECLRWTMEGKTAWELGRILGISEHTAIRHVNRATHKLGAVNKHQAVLRALRLKLIW